MKTSPPPAGRYASSAARIEPLEARIAPAFADVFNVTALSGPNGFQVVGEATNDQAGFSVSDAGDVNGDGFDDIIVSSKEAVGDAGVSYVVFGKAGGFSKSLKLSTLNGTNGFRIVGEKADANSGASVSAAGDVNGDGFGDLLVGAYDDDANGERSGSTYVIFGKASGFAATLNLSTLDGTNGFKISGEAAYDSSGFPVSRAGDVNDDGFDDIILGAFNADPDGESSGAAYVVFGKMSGFPAQLNLSTLNGTNGFKLSGAAEGDYAGRSVSAAGDVNGDGIDDVIVGAPGTDEKGSLTGSAYVIFGSTSAFAAVIPLSSLDGTNGFKITGAGQNHYAGGSVSNAGDVNGDGFDDLIIGARRAAPNGAYSGASFVVFGSNMGLPANLDLATLNGSNGFRINGAAELDESGRAVSGAGDFNGDGFDDLLIGGQGVSGGNGPGAAHVVYGKAGGFAATLELSALDGTNGFRINGAADGNRFGYAVSTAGDVNGDGFADLIVGAPYAGAKNSQTGAGYVIFGGLVTLSSNGRVATFTDTDGDLVKVTTNKAFFRPGDFKLTASGLGFELTELDLTNPLLANAAISISAKQQDVTGDGVKEGDKSVNVGFIDATGVDLKSVSLPGDLALIVAGNGDLAKAGIGTLTVGSLGKLPAPMIGMAPDHSVISDGIGVLNVKTDFAGYLEVQGGTGAGVKKLIIGANLDGSAGGTAAGFLEISGGLGTGLVKGSVIGGADSSGIAVGLRIGTLTIKGGLMSADPAKPVLISALGELGVTKQNKSVALTKLTVNGSVENARILAGYDIDGDAANADASIGVVTVLGTWTASSLVAGIEDSTMDGFGQNDALIGGGSGDVIATIANLTIKGAATGSAAGSDHFGITAESIKKATITNQRQLLGTGANDLLLDATNGDFRVVDFA